MKVNLLRKCSYFLSFLFLSQSAFAISGHGYAGASIDGAFPYVTQSNPKIRYYDGNLVDSYPLNQNGSFQAIGGLQGGYEFSGYQARPAIGLGLGFYSTFNGLAFKGNVNETATGMPTFPLYHYRFNVNSRRLMAELQFTWFIRRFAPFVNVGIGPAWNRFGNYSETVATPEGYVVFPPFRSRTSTQFAYQVGFGVGYLFSFSKCHACSERISLGYRYVNLGSVSSGIRNADYPFKLNFGHLATNNIYLAYTHLF